MGGVVDAVKDVVDSVVDVVSDIVDEVYDFQKNTIGGAQDIYEGMVDISIDFVNDTIDAVDDIGDAIGYMIKEGEWGQLAVIVAMVVLTVVSFGATTPATGAVITASIAGVTSAAVLMTTYYTVMAITMAMSIYSMYNITVSLGELGKMLSAGVDSVVNRFAELRASINLAFVNDWVNGAMSRWMAGGVLYDAPRAGDLLFNPTGSQNTTKFLGLQDTNSNFYVQANILGYFHVPFKRKFGAKAGDEGFSVSSLVKG